VGSLIVLELLVPGTSSRHVGTILLIIALLSFGLLPCASSGSRCRVRRRRSYRAERAGLGLGIAGPGPVLALVSTPVERGLGPPVVLITVAVCVASFLLSSLKVLNMRHAAAQG